MDSLDNSAINKVLAAIDPDELARLAVALVKINSVFDLEAGTSEQEAARLAAGFAAGEGFDPVVEEVAPGRPNVVITYHGRPGPRRLMFEAHTDVVTPGDPAAWRFDPFGGQIDGRRLYGRGANDTKGNLAAMLIALAALKRAGVDLEGSIVAGVLCDEEGMMLGVQDFIARGHADSVTGAVICEPQDGLVCCTQKGAVRARFLVHGRMSHGAMPLSGLNPAPAVARLIDGLAGLEREEIEEHDRDGLLGWPSVTPTVIKSPVKGPGQLNVMPGAAEILVDIRTIPGQSHYCLIEKLNRLAEKVRDEVVDGYRDYDAGLGLRRDLGLKVSAEILTDRPATLTDRTDPVVRAVHWATAEIMGQGPVYAGVPGATDGTYLWALKNIPIVTIGAGDREVPHQADEWVDLDQLLATAKIYALTALAYLSPGAERGGR